MYYEVYVDILFVENLCMNAMLLFLTAWADQANVKLLRIMAAAAAGSLGACMLVIASAWLYGISYFLGSLILAAGMVCIAFPDRRHFLIRMLDLYLESFVFNGILRYLEQFHRASGAWFAVFSGISVLFLTAAEYMFRSRSRKRERTCSAILHHGMCRVSVEALYDTGNGLYDPISGKAVSILDRDMLKRILRESGKESLPRLIPYHTISEKGILEAYILDGIELSSSKGNRWVKRPMVACMPKGNRQYKLILHRDLLSS